MSKPVDHSKAYREVKRQKSQREKEKRERERKSRESQESVDGGRHGSGEAQDSLRWENENENADATRVQVRAEAVQDREEAGRKDDNDSRAVGLLVVWVCKLPPRLYRVQGRATEYVRASSYGPGNKNAPNSNNTLVVVPLVFSVLGLIKHPTFFFFSRMPCHNP